MVVSPPLRGPFNITGGVPVDLVVAGRGVHAVRDLDRVALYEGVVLERSRARERQGGFVPGGEGDGDRPS